MRMIKCNKCGHEWETKSILKYVSCPSCLQKVINKKGDTDEYDKSKAKPAD